MCRARHKRAPHQGALPTHSVGTCPFHRFQVPELTTANLEFVGYNVKFVYDVP